MNAFFYPSKRGINFAKIRGFKVTDYIIRRRYEGGVGRGGVGRGGVGRGGAGSSRLRWVLNKKVR